MIYLIVIMGLVTLVAGGLASCEHKRADANHREAVATQGRFDAYRLSQEDLAEQEKATNDRKEKNWNETNTSNAAVVADLRAELDKRVLNRARSIVRPDGSSISEKACPGPVADAAPGKPVPDPESYVAKAEYLALEDRSGKDALKVVGLQRYITDVCLKD